LLAIGGGKLAVIWVITSRIGSLYTEKKAKKEQSEFDYILKQRADSSDYDSESDSESGSESGSGSDGESGSDSKSGSEGGALQQDQSPQKMPFAPFILSSAVSSCGCCC
jgi:hypothetical protein